MPIKKVETYTYCLSVIQYLFKLTHWKVMCYNRLSINTRDRVQSTTLNIPRIVLQVLVKHLFRLLPITKYASTMNSFKSDRFKDHIYKWIVYMQGSLILIELLTN